MAQTVFAILSLRSTPLNSTGLLLNTFPPSACYTRTFLACYFNFRVMLIHSVLWLYLASCGYGHSGCPSNRSSEISYVYETSACISFSVAPGRRDIYLLRIFAQYLHISIIVKWSLGYAFWIIIIWKIIYGVSPFTIS
jgi:hypothetical protein